MAQLRDRFLISATVNKVGLQCEFDGMTSEIMRDWEPVCLPASSTELSGCRQETAGQREQPDVLGHSGPGVEWIGFIGSSSLGEVGRYHAVDAMRGSRYRSVMNLRREELLKVRFMMNMGRITRLVRALVDDKGSDLFDLLIKVDDVRADQLRAIVVFLHATFETVLRSHFRRPDARFTFCGRSDLDNALRLSDIDPAPFRRLYNPLVAMAKRRTRIVHEADLPTRQTTVEEPWRIADTWQLIMWLMAVPAFYYRLRESVGVADAVERKMLERLHGAMQHHVAFANRLLEVVSLEGPERPAALQEALTVWTTITEMLNLKVQDFVSETDAATS